MRVLGVIPARGGSKGVRKKNIRIVAGEPLIAYSIKAAKESKMLDDFVVSTDDPEIERISRDYGAFVIPRPAEIATDDAPVYKAVLHAIDVMSKHSGKTFGAAVLLQPTSPIRRGADIDMAIKILSDENVDCVVSVCLMDDVHPARMYQIDSGGFLKSLWGEFEKVRRQDLPPVYYRNGAIYAIKIDVLKQEKSFMCKRKKPLIMPVQWMVNIDNERDLLIADVMLRLWKEGKL